MSSISWHFFTVLVPISSTSGLFPDPWGRSFPLYLSPHPSLCTSWIPSFHAFLSFYDDILHFQPYILKRSLYLPDCIVYKGFHPFDHDHKSIPAFIHVPDIFSAEVSTVQDESCILVFFLFDAVTFVLKCHAVFRRDLTDKHRERRVAIDPVTYLFT